MSSQKDITQQTEKYKYGVSKNQWMNKNNIVDEHLNDSKSVLNHIPATAQTVLLKIFARKNWGSKYQKTIFIVPIPLETETTYRHPNYLSFTKLENKERSIQSKE